MYSWYRAGFVENIVMAIIGILIGAYEFYLYSLNRGEYYRLLDDLDDMRKPMMNTTMSMSTLNSKGSGAHSIHFGPQPPRCPSRSMNPSIGGASTSGLLPNINAINNNNTSMNDAGSGQYIVTGSGRLSSRQQKPFSINPSDRILIDENDPEQE